MPTSYQDKRGRSAGFTRFGTRFSYRLPGEGSTMALLFFALRYLIRPEDWSDRLVAFSFWTLNLGLAWMIFFNLFPLGVLQLGDSVANGYWHARSIEFFRTHARLEWLRLPGDILFISGVVPVVYLTGKAVFRRRPMPEPEPAGVESQESPLFREVVLGNREGGEARPAEGPS